MSRVESVLGRLPLTVGLLALAFTPAGAAEIEKVDEKLETCEHDAGKECYVVRYKITTGPNETVSDFHINIGKTTALEEDIADVIKFRKTPADWSTSVLKEPNDAMERPVWLNWFTGAGDVAEPIGSNSSNDEFEMEMETGRGDKGSPTYRSTCDGNEDPETNCESAGDAPAPDQAGALGILLQEAVGRCDLPMGGGCTTSTQETCTLLGGTFMAGQSCPKGACCSSGCWEVSAADCDAGSYQGDGTSCATPGICPTCPDVDMDGFSVCGACVPDTGDVCGDCNDAAAGADCCPDLDADGYAVCGGSCGPEIGDVCGDCDDTDPSVNPGSLELCDGTNNDCNGGTADGSAEPWFNDPCDGSDFDLCADGNLVCTAAAQTCNDDPSGFVEVCDGADNDCNPATEDGSMESWLNQPCDGGDADFCNEGYYSCSGGSQSCSDNTSDNVDLCGNGADEDCNGSDTVCPSSVPSVGRYGLLLLVAMIGVGMWLLSRRRPF